MKNHWLTPDWLTLTVAKQMADSMSFTNHLIKTGDIKPIGPLEMAAIDRRRAEYAESQRAALLGRVVGIKHDGGNLDLIYEDGHVVTVYGCGYEADGVDWSLSNG